MELDASQATAVKPSAVNVDARGDEVKNDAPAANRLSSQTAGRGAVASADVALPFGRPVRRGCQTYSLRGVRQATATDDGAHESPHAPPAFARSVADEWSAGLASRLLLQ